MRLLLLLAVLVFWPAPTMAQVETPEADTPPTDVPGDPPPAPVWTAPYATAPICESHDNRAWHGLWDGFRLCHYDHQHGDNPHDVDDLFGTSLFALMGGEVSHPWQTFSNAGYENDLKHAGYFWHVRRDIPCDFGQRGCITAFRALVHQHPTPRDAPVRFHSGVLEAALLDTVTGRTGYIQVPGVWVDFGDLLVDGKVALDVEGNGNRHKQHGSAEAAATPQIIWYGASQGSHATNIAGNTPQGFIRLSTSVHDVWDYTSPTDPANLDAHNICYGRPRCPNNATLLRPHLITVSIPRMAMRIVDPDHDRIADWTGYTDRYGVVVEGCSAASLDCVPMTLRGLDVDVTYVCEQFCQQSYREYDVYFDGVTSGWSQPVP